MSTKSEARHWRVRRALGLLLALTLISAACGGGDDPDQVGSAPAATDSGSSLVSADESADEEQPVDDASDEAAETTTTEVDAGQADGSGTVPIDVCANGQFVAGAITIDDLVSWGVLPNADVTLDGGGASSAQEYDTFGFLCNVKGPDDDVLLSISINAGTDAADEIERLGVAPTVIGSWEFVVRDMLTPLMMAHTDADGQQDSLFLFWWPEEDPDEAELTRVLTPLAEAFASATTTDFPRL